MRERGCKKSGEKCHGRPGFRHSPHINEFFLSRHENLGREEKSNMWGWLAFRLIADESAEVEWKDLYDDDDPYRARFITRSLVFQIQIRPFFPPSRRCVDLGRRIEN